MRGSTVLANVIDKFQKDFKAIYTTKRFVLGGSGEEGHISMV